MRTKRIHGWIGGASLAVVLLWTVPVSAQTTFSSGSTGALGAFNPSSNTAVTLPPDGVLNYTTINVPSGVTVTFVRNAANTPVTMLATGDVTIAGTINVNGVQGVASTGTASPAFNVGGLGGPGGYSGGQSGSYGLTNNNASAGQGPGGGAPGATSSSVGTYGASGAFVSLIPLFGGSGSGGVNGGSTFNGTSGSGGGGAIVIASTTKITVTGSVTANGGAQVLFGCGFNGCAQVAGVASGGAIRLVAPQITASGSLSAQGANQDPTTAGRIRIEAVTTGAINPTLPVASIVNTLGPITAASTPALINLPILTISAVGGVASPAIPTGSYTTADVSLPTGTTNPVTVNLTMNNVPISTVFTVKLIPQFASPTNVSSTASAGSFAVSTATTNVTFPSGSTSILNAFAGFTLTSKLFPLIDGEEVDRVLVGATYGEPSSATLVTKSGKEIRVDRLPIKDQLAFAKGWEAMQRAQ